MSSRLNYLIWKKSHKSILEDLPNKKVVVTHSGGKDGFVDIHFFKASEGYNLKFETRVAILQHHVPTGGEATFQ